jgi:hypothetical protein
MKEEFNAPNALLDAVKANDVARAEKLIAAGAKPDSHMLAIAFDDKFAVPNPEHMNSVSADDLLMAKLLLQHGADVNGNNHEPIIKVCDKISVLSMLLLYDMPNVDYSGALKSMKKLPQYQGPEFRRAKDLVRYYARKQNSLGKRVQRTVKAAKEKFGL